MFFLGLLIDINKRPGRSWRREFGAASEWGRRGMFRVIGMEQFANSLLEASELLT